jgi:hypothetical protein
MEKRKKGKEEKENKGELGGGRGWLAGWLACQP